MSRTEPEPDSAARTASGQPIGIGRVLDQVRNPPRCGTHVVDFRDVTKTYHPDTPHEFTAIRNVGFVVETWSTRASSSASWVRAAAARARSCG